MSSAFQFDYLRAVRDVSWKIQQSQQTFHPSHPVNYFSIKYSVHMCRIPLYKYNLLC